MASMRSPARAVEIQSVPGPAPCRETSMVTVRSRGVEFPDGVAAVDHPVPTQRHAQHQVLPRLCAAAPRCPGPSTPPGGTRAISALRSRHLELPQRGVSQGPTGLTHHVSNRSGAMSREVYQESLPIHHPTEGSSTTTRTRARFWRRAYGVGLHRPPAGPRRGRRGSRCPDPRRRGGVPGHLRRRHDGSHFGESAGSVEVPLDGHDDARSLGDLRGQPGNCSSRPTAASARSPPSTLRETTGWTPRRADASPGTTTCPSTTS